MPLSRISPPFEDSTAKRALIVMADYMVNRDC